MRRNRAASFEPGSHRDYHPHTTLDHRSNNEEGLVAALVEGDGRKLAGLLSVLVLTAVAAMLTRRRKTPDPRLPSSGSSSTPSSAHHISDKDPA